MERNSSNEPEQEKERKKGRKKTKGKGNEGKKKVTVPGGKIQHGLTMTGANATSLANRRQKGLVHLAPEISQKKKMLAV